MPKTLLALAALLALPALAAPLVVVIDPGHGGTQSGASGAGALEKTVALELSLKLKERLEAALGATVRLTRDRDAHVQLSDRVRWANAQKPDLFISIHLNSMPTKRQQAVNEGIETYFLSASASGEAAKKVAARENAEAGPQVKAGGDDTLSFILADLQRSEAHTDSSRLAYAVQEALIGATGSADRGVQQAPFYVLMGLQAPAILVEVGFLSHPAEGKRLREAQYQEQLAEAITQGVKGFLAQMAAREGQPAP